MMPICPAAFAIRLVGFITRFNRHIRHQALLLPLLDIFSDDLFNLAFPRQILFRDCGKKSLFLLFVQAVGGYPLNAIQPLLKNIVRARFELLFFPAAQAVGGVAIRILVIAAQGFNRRGIGFAV